MRRGELRSSSRWAAARRTADIEWRGGFESRSRLVREVVSIPSTYPEEGVTTSVKRYSRGEG